MARYQGITKTNGLRWNAHISQIAPLAFSGLWYSRRNLCSTSSAVKLAACKTRTGEYLHVPTSFRQCCSTPSLATLCYVRINHHFWQNYTNISCRLSSIILPQPAFCSSSFAAALLSMWVLHCKSYLLSGLCGGDTFLLLLVADAPARYRNSGFLETVPAFVFCSAVFSVLNFYNSLNKDGRLQISHIRCLSNMWEVIKGFECLLQSLPLASHIQDVSQNAASSEITFMQPAATRYETNKQGANLLLFDHSYESIGCNQPIYPTMCDQPR